MKFNLLASASTFAISALTAWALPTPAQAGLTCSASSCTETVSLAATKTDFANAPVTLDMFNASASQTLTSVVISDAASFSAVGSLLNTSNSQQTFTFQAGLGLSLVGGTGAPSNFPFIFASGSINPQHYTLNAGQSVPYNFSNLFSSGIQTITGADVAGFIGSSTFQAQLDANAVTSFSGGGNNIKTNLTTTATPAVTITYNFTTSASSPVQPVPEPQSLGILGTGLIGMGVMRRRRNKA